MSLFEDLRAAAGTIDPQFQVTANEVPGVLSALVHHLEHPDDFLKAAEEGGVEAVTELLAPAPPPEAPPSDPTAPAAAPSPDVAELEKELSDLRAQLASRQATAQQTTVTHEEGAPPPPDTSVI
jgi:hypothetical protein